MILGGGSTSANAHALRLGLAGLLACAAYIDAQDWVLTSSYNDWRSIASSLDGTKLGAVAYGGGIYLSTNSGATWNPSSAPLTNWVSIASSWDGTKLLAAAGGDMLPGAVYVSTDSGETWAPSAVPTGVYGFFQSVACSADGVVLAAGSAFLASHGFQGTDIYVSANSGATWLSTNLWPALTGLACSADGTRLMAATMVLETGCCGYLFASTNQGVSWEPSSAPADQWRCIACSADGTTLFALTTTTAYRSMDSGNTWTLTTVTNESWSCVACSADGSKVVAATGYEGAPFQGAIYTSADSGLTWISNSVPGLSWRSVASSADGCKLVAASNNGIYVRHTTPKPVLAMRRSGTGVVLSWVVPSREFVLQANPYLAAPDWTDVDAPPALNCTNLHYEVSLPIQAGPVFYRLASK